MKTPNSTSSNFHPFAESRTNNLGKMTAMFITDGEETNNECNVSEWWLEPEMKGPHAHQHNDKIHVMYILEGTVSFQINDKWSNAEKGTFVRIPKNTLHTFANRTKKKAGFLKIEFPSGSEKEMPSTMKWFEENEE
ncbi:MAG: cupin domain-containing protein [Porphyromonadaceae bacterium]|nr:cupin domain-containing protein [Porphyromonadaceae bacterium]